MHDLFDLHGRGALVTGATGGLGIAICEALAMHGAELIVSDIEASACEDLAGRLRDAGQRARGIAADLSRHEQVDALVAAAGAVDVLVCNAGIQGPAGPLGALADADIDRVLEVNLKSALRLTQALVPGMAARGGGSVILMSSIAGLRGNRAIGLYGLSKAALAQLAIVELNRLAGRSLLPVAGWFALALLRQMRRLKGSASIEPCLTLVDALGSRWTPDAAWTVDLTGSLAMVARTAESLAPLQRVAVWVERLSEGLVEQARRSDVEAWRAPLAAAAVRCASLPAMQRLAEAMLEQTEPDTGSGHTLATLIEALANLAPLELVRPLVDKAAKAWPKQPAIQVEHARLARAGGATAPQLAGALRSLEAGLVAQERGPGLLLLLGRHARGAVESRQRVLGFGRILGARLEHGAHGEDQHDRGQGCHRQHPKASARAVVRLALLNLLEVAHRGVHVLPAFPDPCGSVGGDVGHINTCAQKNYVSFCVG